MLFQGGGIVVWRYYRKAHLSPLLLLIPCCSSSCSFKNGMWLATPLATPLAEIDSASMAPDSAGRRQFQCLNSPRFPCPEDTSFMALWTNQKVIKGKDVGASGPFLPRDSTSLHLCRRDTAVDKKTDSSHSVLAITEQRNTPVLRLACVC